MTKAEKLERLSEIARARMTDYMTMGADGSWCNVGPESPFPAAVCELKSRTEYDDKTSQSTVHTSVKLHDPVRAIAEMNKMVGDYEPEKVEHSGEVKITRIEVVRPC
jgi:hypothetical protein